MLSALMIPPPVWLALATAGWYLASRTLAGPHLDRFGFAALALPFGATCVAAVLLGHPEVAISVAVAGSVACLTLVLGLVGLTHPIIVAGPPPRHWLFVLPTALICLLIGFSGEIRSIHALALLVQGGAILLASYVPVDRRVPLTRRIPLSFIAVLALIVASLLAVRTADVISRGLQQSSSGLVAAVMLAPALALPMIGVTSRMATERASRDATNLIVKVVLINLCLFLPLSALAWQLRPAMALFDPPAESPATMPTTQATTEPAEAIEPPAPRRFVYPLTVWRIDTMLILALGVVLLLLALGRIQLGRAESTGLLIVYVVYLAITAFSAR